MIPEEQLKAVKEKIISMIDPNLPEAQKQQAIQQINSMSAEQLEEFIKQNNLAGQSGNTGKEGECIFCSIANEKVESYKLDENKNAIAVLELNPLSEGHSLIIPKKHVSTSGDIPSQAFTLAKKISKKIKTKLKPQNIQISNSNMLGHEVIQVIPVYKDQDPKQERKPATKDELFRTQYILEKKKKPKTVKPIKKQVIDADSKETKVKLPVRIP